MRETQQQKKKRISQITKILKRRYPDARCALDYGTAWQLLVATILSAQCTDKRVNMVTPGLFKKYPGVKDIAKLRLSELEKEIHSTGFYKNKARNIKGAAVEIIKEHQGEVPDTMEALVKLPGVGRKTANVLLGNYFGKNEGITVDTHMIRISRLLGLTKHKDAVKVEKDLMPLIPINNWTHFTHLIILHGRETCIARRPACAKCPILKDCPSIQS